MSAGTTQGPREQLVILVRLQSLDRERDSNQRLLDQSAGIIAAREKQLDGVRAMAAQAHEDLRRARADADEAELELRSHTEQIQKLELQLNTAKTNQEYQALQGHIGKLREESARREDDALELYERIEQLEGRVKEAEQKKLEGEAEFEEFTASCERDKQEAQKELDATEDRRRSLLEELPDDLRDNYERVRNARDGIGIAALEDGCCAACGVTITPNDRAKLIGCTQVVNCNSCSRILYLPEALNVSG